MKKIVIISYFFPPCSKAGSHRAYSMAEYLPRFGWEPIFIAPANGYYGRLNRVDDSLLEKFKTFKVYRIPFFYPFNNKKTTRIARGTRLLWETFNLPDGKILWNKQVKKRINGIINLHRPDVVFITATPFSSFLLAPYIKEKFHLPIILDYRDPWAANPFVEKNHLKAKLTLRLEKKSLKSADLVTTASYFMIRYIKSKLCLAAENKNFFGFPYGFNGDFFKENILPISESNLNLKLNGVFAGSVHGDINPETILKGIRLAIHRDNELRKHLFIRCYGTLFGSSKDTQNLIKKYGLDQNISVEPFVSYEEFLSVLRKSSFLILPHGDSPVARVLYPTKFFDYLGVRRPILYIGGDGQVSETIMRCNAGICAIPQTDSIASVLAQILEKVNSHHWYDRDLEYNSLDRKFIFKDFCNNLNSLSSRGK